MEELNAIKIEETRLLRLIDDANRQTSSVRFGFILGADASISSGIPSAYKLATRWYNELKEDIGEDALKNWSDSIEDFNMDNISAFFTQIFKKRFESNYTIGYEQLKEYMNSAQPSIGYSFLTQILNKSFNKFVITTSFDKMLEDAFFEIGDTKPLVLGYDILNKYINTLSPMQPTIIKVHKDFLFSPLDTEKKMDKKLKKSLKPVLRNNSMIVLGYDGNDESLMTYLKQRKNRKPIYWCYIKEREISDNIKELLTKDDFLIQITSFDKFMLLVSDKLGFESLEHKEPHHQIKDTTSNTKNYTRKLEKLAYEPLSTKEQKAIQKLLPSWWSYQLSINNEDNIEKKDKMYNEGLRAYPQSHKLMGNYANFLCDVRKKYEKAEKYYLKALELNPLSANVNGNYANFLKNIHKEYDKASEYYQKALELNPNHANNNGNYAIYLHTVAKDYKKAEKYYKKALSLDSHHINNVKNYELFLLDKENKKSK
jgi:tetratricopeptide (TPR) repeat protein